MIVIPKDIRKNPRPPIYGSKPHVKIKNELNYSVVDVLENRSRNSIFL